MGHGWGWRQQLRQVIPTTFRSNQHPQVVLSEDNYTIVKAVEGEWSATYVFGIGGLKKKALETNAIGEMYKNAQLTGNQQIINITTTQSVETWAFGIYAKYKVVARGYVIEFVK